MDLLEQSQSGQVAQTPVIAGRASLSSRLARSPTDDECVLYRATLALQQPFQAGHVVPGGGDVSGTAGPQAELKQNAPVGRDVQPDLDLAFVHRRVVCKAKIDVLAIGVSTMQEEGGQVVEDD